MRETMQVTQHSAEVITKSEEQAGSCGSSILVLTCSLSIYVLSSKHLEPGNWLATLDSLSSTEELCAAPSV